MIKNFGKRVQTVWKDLRPMTKEMLVGAMKTKFFSSKKSFAYDVHVDWELSNLLNALDEQVKDSAEIKGETKLADIHNLAEICAEVLETQTESAEIFIQLAKRALAKNDFNKIDKLADALLERFSAGEIAEIIRQTELAQIRAISYETLAVMPAESIEKLLNDPLYFEIGCTVLEQKAIEFGSGKARKILERLETGLAFEDFQ